ncbi:MAG: U32 family peptidase [Clostridiales bacterium]|nr:U32 family peptidase [Clostridiales bacterium]
MKMERSIKKPELLIPAGSPEVLRVAVTYGADAVYIGGESFGLRAGAKNFTPAGMREGIAFAHREGVRVYVTVNIFAHENDLAGIRDYLLSLKELRPDALIISDPGVFVLAREICPDIDIHISTQANNTNSETFLFWYELGAKRVVAARELSLEEIGGIRSRIPSDMEIEAFVHGAMCVSYSGRCLLSNYLTGRDGNQGACTHPCRWKYTLEEEKRPGQYLPVFEDGRGTYIMNSADLCMIDHIPDLADAGVDSLKVEGRMKSALYVAVVTKAYRRAIDDHFRRPHYYQEHAADYLREVSECTRRKFSTGFFYGKPDDTAMIYDSNTYIRDYTFLGVVGERTADGYFRIEQKNKFSVGETIEIVRPESDNIEVTVKDIRNEEGLPQESAPHPRQILYINVGHEMEMYDVLRRKEEE